MYHSDSQLKIINEIRKYHHETGMTGAILRHIQDDDTQRHMVGFCKF